MSLFGDLNKSLEILKVGGRLVESKDPKAPAVKKSTELDILSQARMVVEGKVPDVKDANIQNIINKLYEMAIKEQDSIEQKENKTYFGSAGDKIYYAVIETGAPVTEAPVGTEEETPEETPVPAPEVPETPEEEPGPEAAEAPIAPPEPEIADNSIKKITIYDVAEEVVKTFDNVDNLDTATVIDQLATELGLDSISFQMLNDLDLLKKPDEEELEQTPLAAEEPEMAVAQKDRPEPQEQRPTTSREEIFKPRESLQEAFLREHEEMLKDVAFMKEHLEEKAPEGWEGTILRMKKDNKVTNPWALAHWMKGKGYKPRKSVPKEGVEENRVNETAHGQLYVDENCRDVFQEELDAAFGENNWRLDGSEFSDVWNESELPDVMTVPVIGSNDEQIGTAEITNRFYIETADLGGEKYIAVEPESIKITQGASMATEARQDTKMFEEPVELPTIDYAGKKYYVDNKLQQIRAVDDPHNNIAFDDLDQDTLDAVISIITTESANTVLGLDPAQKANEAKVSKKELAAAAERTKHAMSFLRKIHKAIEVGALETVMDALEKAATKGDIDDKQETRLKDAWRRKKEALANNPKETEPTAEEEKSVEADEGYEEPGKRDGTGPYKGGAQRQLTGNKGKRKLAGEECPFEEDETNEAEVTTATTTGDENGDRMPLIKPAKTEAERREATKRLDYARKIGDNVGVMIALAQLGSGNESVLQETGYVDLVKKLGKEADTYFKGQFPTGAEKVDYVADAIADASGTDVDGGSYRKIAKILGIDLKESTYQSTLDKLLQDLHDEKITQDEYDTKCEELKREHQAKREGAPENKGGQQEVEQREARGEIENEGTAVQDRGLSRSDIEKKTTAELKHELRSMTGVSHSRQTDTLRMWIEDELDKRDALPYNEGKDTPGKRTGTGPYKGSYRGARRLKGRRNLAGLRCPVVKKRSKSKSEAFKPSIAGVDMGAGWKDFLESIEIGKAKRVDFDNGKSLMFRRIGESNFSMLWNSGFESQEHAKEAVSESIVKTDKGWVKANEQV